MSASLPIVNERIEGYRKALILAGKDLPQSIKSRISAARKLEGYMARTGDTSSMMIENFRDYCLTTMKVTTADYYANASGKYVLHLRRQGFKLPRQIRTEVPTAKKAIIEARETIVRLEAQVARFKRWKRWAEGTGFRATMGNVHAAEWLRDNPEPSLEETPDDGKPEPPVDRSARVSRPRAQEAPGPAASEAGPDVAGQGHPAVRSAEDVQGI